METKSARIENADEEEELYGADFDNRNGYPEFEKIIPQQYVDHRSTKLTPPDLTELSRAREKRKREMRISQIVKEVILYVLFLIALFVVSFGQRDPKAYLVAKLIEDTYLGGAYSSKGLNEVRFMIFFSYIVFTAPFLRFFDFLRINNICVGAWQVYEFGYPQIRFRHYFFSSVTLT